MTFDAAMIAASVILFITFTVTIVVVTQRRLAAQDEELRQQASMRGWTFQRAREGALRVRRWTGTTDGVAWIAESLESNQGGTHGHAAARRRTVTRWRTAPDWTPSKTSVTAPIVLMGIPEGKDIPALAGPQSDGWAVKLMQKATGFAFDKMIDVYFGKDAGGDVDAGAMQRVKDDSIPGYVVMAADPGAATRLLFQGLSAAVTTAATSSSSILSEQDRPWILIWTKGLILARMERLSSAEQVERFVRAGLTIVRQLNAGRWSSS